MLVEDPVRAGILDTRKKEGMRQESWKVSQEGGDAARELEGTSLKVGLIKDS
jgi:hypothetical protein